MLRRHLCLTAALFIASSLPAYAVTYYCATPHGSGYISLGDTIAKVQSICGTPSAVRQIKTSTTDKQEIQVWTYAPPWLAGTYAQQPRKSGIFAARQDIKTEIPSVSFQVVDSKVISITGSPNGSAQQWRCPTGAIVQVGDPATRITSACGQASSISTVMQNVKVAPQTRVEWLYQLNTYSAPLRLEFQNNSLMSVQ